MNIEELKQKTTNELKVMAYDLFVKMQNEQELLKVISDLIAQKGQDEKVENNN